MRSKNSKIIFLLLIFFLVVGIIKIMTNKNIHSKSITVWSRFEPTSSDPLNYDLAIHHLTMRSVLGSLVSVYKNGQITPQIAKTWSSSDDKTEWQLEIDNLWTFENNEIITPEIVVSSLTRLIYLKNIQKSKSGLLEFLLEVDNVVGVATKFKGITTNGKYVVFKFIKPIPDFLDKISFGIYAIVHPSSYDEKGKWINEKKLIASGAYKISKWEKNIFNLELRNNLYINSKSKQIEEIIFNFSKNINVIRKSDIMFREKVNPFADKDNWDFYSTSANNNITYIKIMKWNDKSSIFSKKQTRTILRNIFYKSLEEEGVEVTKSFFPLSIKGVKPFNSFAHENYNYEKNEFKSQPYFIDPDLEAAGIKELGLLFKNAFMRFTTSINATPVINEYPDKLEEEEKAFDIQFLGTGILIDSPDEDIKFMFLSKQGIMLPDENGEILELLKTEKLEVQKINQALWDQAIIWPVRHYSTGVWLKKNSNLSLSNLNIALHPIDFQFLEWKE